MAFRIISFERTSNNLACALQCFFCLFCARFALFKTGYSNRNLTKRGLKIEAFLQKTQIFFLRFFILRPPSKVTNFNTSHMPPPPFGNFSLDTLISEQKPSVKKPVDRAGQKPVDRPSTGNDFENYRSGRIKKILTGFISAVVQMFIEHWGDEPLPRFFSVEQIQVKTKKKRSSPKTERLFSPKSAEDHKKRSSPKTNTFFLEFKWRPSLGCTPESNYWRGCR